MCGIAGYVGPRKAVHVVLDQLKRLEYRGYDSAGVASVDHGDIQILKRAGKLVNLERVVSELETDAHLAIGHSRWATHGAPTDQNAHPHFDQFEKIAIIHNGIIENYLELKEELVRRGHTFRSETDTEIAAHVIGEEYARTGDLELAVRNAVRRFRGAYALVVVSRDDEDQVIAVRNANPIVLGIGEGENLLASDIPALLPYTRQVAFLDDGQIAVLRRDGVRIVDLDGRSQPLVPIEIDWDLAVAEKGGYDHFMLKEIHEQPEVIRQSMAGRVLDDGVVRFENLFSEHVWLDIDRVVIIGCGTAYHAGLMGKYMFESLLRLPTDVFYSSEFRYGDPVLSPRSLAIFVSQSGETADTLAALQLCRERRIRTLGVVNVIGSSVARNCDRTIFTQAGPEISVASTKAYVAQVMVFAMLALHVAQVRETPGVRVYDAVAGMRKLPEHAQLTLNLEEHIRTISEAIQGAPLFFFLGRGADAYVALEGALKMKEVAYIPTQESPAGEMKHGPLALVEPGVVAIFGATDPQMRDKVLSNMKEIQAREGKVLVVTTEDDTLLPSVADWSIVIPSTKFAFLDALVSAIPMQLLAYFVAALRGCEIDMPRNLAKSVTVE